MLRILLSFLLLVFLWQLGDAQTINNCSYKPPRQGETWCFYSKLKLEFHNGNVSSSALPAALSFGKGCASISDEDGNLIMYTDGAFLWDKNSNIITKVLNGTPSCTQTALFVPNPSNNGIYYVFTTQLPYPSPNPSLGLQYSIINHTTAVGIDTFPSKKLLDLTPEKLTGVRHANGHDYWVVAHGWDNNSFYSYKVTDSGVDTNVVQSSVGMVHTGTSATRNTLGYMKLSVDGSRLALAISGSNIVEWFDFNNRTGEVSDVRQISSPDGGKPFGIEFSPDSKYLYFTSTNLTTNATNNLYQVDLVAGTAPVLINPLVTDVTALQLAVDGKIYVIRYKQSFLGVIENPTRPGISCNFNDQGYDLGTGKGLIGFPDIIQSYFNIPAITYDTKCFGDDTYFFLTNDANIDSLQWDFGDPGSGSANSDTALKPFHKFSMDGVFNVNVTEWFNNQSFVTSIPVTIHKLPRKSFWKFPADSTYILPGSEIPLDGGDFMTSYLWSDFSTNQYLTVSQPGIYNVTIVDTNCCQESDTLKVLFLDLLVPSAFSPNSDGLNDRFHVKGPTQGIENYHFYVYNRWGQLIWDTDSFDDSWDGNFKGAPCPADVYTWVMKFGVSGNLLKKDKVLKRGVISIIK
jgi:gliding motility-associated-like protein